MSIWTTISNLYYGGNRPLVSYARFGLCTELIKFLEEKQLPCPTHAKAFLTDQTYDGCENAYLVVTWVSGMEVTFLRTGMLLFVAWKNEYEYAERVTLNFRADADRDRIVEFVKRWTGTAVSETGTGVTCVRAPPENSALETRNV